MLTRLRHSYFYLITRVGRHPEFDGLRPWMNFVELPMQNDNNGMDTQQRAKFSEVLSAQIRRLKEWLKPDPEDHVVVKAIKMLLKGLVLLLLIAASPILLIGLALIFIGLM